MGSPGLLSKPSQTRDVDSPYALPERPHIEVLEAIGAQQRPLTIRQLARLSGLPEIELQQAVEALRELGLVSRLNTVIESYIVASP